VPLNGGFEEQIATLLAARPSARTIGTIHDPRTLSRPLGRLRETAAKRGLSVVARPARSPADVDRALAALADEPVDAFFLLLDPAVIDAAAFEAIRRFTHARGAIFVVPDRSLVTMGGTFSFAPGFAAMGEHAAFLARLIVEKGARPRDIGERFPSIRYLSVNPMEAGRLGIPASPERLLPSPQTDQIEHLSLPHVETP
jgi:ABC-type uncharacterized transport system substrate-binding protein